MLSTSGPNPSSDTVEIRLFPAPSPNAPYPAELDVEGWRSFLGLSITVDFEQLVALELDAREYGLRLGEMVFADNGCGPAYRETLAVVRGRGGKLRVRLRLDASELQALRWERLHQPYDGNWHPLGSTANTPFSRYIPAQQWDRPLPITTRPLKVLLVIASPQNLGEYQLDEIPQSERQVVHNLFAPSSDMQVTALESNTPQRPTLAALRQHLATGYHLVHFLCHGASMPGGTVLFLEDEAGQVRPVPTAQVTDLTKALATPPLFCFLAACETAARSRHDGYLPLGPALVADGGFQAVVAMNEKVGLQTAQQFTGQFYNRLLTHGLVDLAVNEARAFVQDEWDWGAPVLYSRLPDNQLLDFPIGSIYASYLTHSEYAFHAADEALVAARRLEHGQQLVDDLEKLIKELSKSHEVLVKVASSFRRTGSEPATFPAQFEAFYYDFKEYYDSQTWVNEDTSCRAIFDISSQLLPKLVPPILDPSIYARLVEELGFLSNADADLLRYFREYLDMMNGWVEEIWALLTQQKVTEAIARKQEVTLQISPSLQRSKGIFERMSNSITAVAAA